VSTAVGVGLAVGGTAFVVEKIVAGWSTYGEIVAGARQGWLLAGLALALGGMSAFGLVWWRIIGALGGAASRREVCTWYLLGNLGKYVPGGLWPLVGRSELAARGGLDRAVAYNSVALSMGATYLCAGLVSALLLPFVLLTRAPLDAPLWVLGLVPAGLVVLHPAILGRLLRIAGRVLGDGAAPVVPPWLTSVGLVLRHAPPWLAIAVATWFVARTFTPDAPILLVLFAGIVSWVIGFVVIFVPGGIGVREAAFTAIASVAMPPEVAATVAIVSRLVFMAADALSAALAAGASMVAARRSAASSK
jgi:uncharacterized membrane protein YbhN (UPF0104 family)